MKTLWFFYLNVQHRIKMTRHKRGRKICAIIKKKKTANRNRPAGKVIEFADRELTMTMINVLRKIEKIDEKMKDFRIQ